MAIAELDPNRPFGLSLRVQAEDELDRITTAGSLSPAFEHRYRTETAAARARELRVKTLQCASIYSIITLLLNMFVVVAPVWRNVAVQVVVTPVLGMLISWRFFRPHTPDVVRENAALAAGLVYAVSVIVAVYCNPPVAAAHDLALVALPVNFVLVFVHLRLRASVIFVAACIAALALSVVLRTDLAPTEQAFPVGFLAALCAPTLFAVHDYQRSARRIYLHGLLQRLRIEQLSAENESLAHLSATDPLTGAANRRRLDRELKVFCAAQEPVGAFLLIDLDGFKAFNDRYGHLAGDRCLQEIASCMAAQLRRHDLLARFGGEEFAVLMPDTNPDDALEAAERLRQAVEAHRFVVDGDFTCVSISIGVADLATFPDPTLLLGAADGALYAAKKAGRNRVCAAGFEVAPLYI